MEIADVKMLPGAPPVVAMTLTDGQVLKMPLQPPVIALLNAGGWLMREYVAKVFEEDLGGANMVSRRIRLMNAGERPPAAA